jgi:hypothetical protein
MERFDPIAASIERTRSKFGHGSVDQGGRAAARVTGSASPSRPSRSVSRHSIEAYACPPAIPK